MQNSKDETPASGAPWTACKSLGALHPARQLPRPKKPQRHRYIYPNRRSSLQLHAPQATCITFHSPRVVGQCVQAFARPRRVDANGNPQLSGVWEKLRDEGESCRIRCSLQPLPVTAGSAAAALASLPGPGKNPARLAGTAACHRTRQKPCWPWRSTLAARRISSWLHTPRRYW